MVFDHARGQLTSFLEKVLSAVGEAAGSVLGRVVEAVRTIFEGDPETRKQVAFSVAMIALSAKIAKADGIVSRAEVDAFRQIFEFPESEAAHVARLYNLAKQDVAGIEAYATQMATLCRTCAGGPCQILDDVLDGLFHIAKADGLIHENEMAYLARIAEIFGFDKDYFERVKARHLHVGGTDPYDVLGVSPSDDFPEIRRRYRSLVSEHHPDRLIARGVPVEFHAVAHERMAALNAAYEAIEKERRAA
ncbi:DnaJ family molecular chaperone [Rhizobiaceae bacterium BDR2-2]|uniref:DnaJ family molecular chaperone n=1 Tax=Ectorhizobium quercum TaxID=2965071 RepID=A0AAE3MY60_9HYPH|nr:DnaJ family molecular chaperone [Ectorhizobium quercum]MCX8996477.1 DnaJ family molecular chaperone [Ectorhizobium quercum]